MEWLWTEDCCFWNPVSCAIRYFRVFLFSHFLNIHRTWSALALTQSVLYTRHHLVGKHQLKPQLINNSRFVRICIISWWWNIRKVIFVLCSPLIVNSLFTQHIARKRIFALEWKKQYVRRIGGLLTQSQEKQSLEFQTFFLQDGCTGSYFEHAIVKAGFPVSCAVLAFLVSLENVTVRFWWWLWNLATIVRCGQSFEIVLQTWSIYFWFS